MVSKVISVSLKDVLKVKPTKRKYVFFSISNIHFDLFLRCPFFLDLQICSYFNIYYLRDFLDNTAKNIKRFKLKVRNIVNFNKLIFI